MDDVDTRVPDAAAHQLDDVFRLSPSCMVIVRGPDHVFERANERYLELIGQRNIVGRRARDVLPEMASQGFVDLLDRVYRTGEPYVGHAVPFVMRRPGGASETRVFDFVYQPMRDAQGRITGVFGQAVDLTPAHDARTALAATQARLELLVGHMRDYAVILLDAEGRVQDWLADAERVTGFSAADMLGRTLEPMFTPEDRESGELTHELATARERGKAEDRRWHVRKDGTRFFANGVMVALREADGALRGYGKLFRDETRSQRDAERRLHLLGAAQRVLEADETGGDLAVELFDGVRDAVGADLMVAYRADGNGVLQLVAHAGVDAADLPGTASVDVRDGCCAAVVARAAPVVGADEVGEDAAAAIAALGARAWACHPLFGRDGRVFGTFAIGSRHRDAFDDDDVQLLQTAGHFLALAWDRQSAVEALADVTRRSEQRRRLYETILGSTPDLVYVFDLEHRFTYANAVLLQMWGRSWDEAIGRNCLELGYPDWHAAMHDREIEEVRATRRPIRGEVPFAGTFGRRIYEYIFVPVFGPDGEVEAVAGTTRDVTERKEFEDELAALLAREQRRASQLARLAEVGTALGRLRSVDAIAQRLADEARAVIGAHQAVASLTVSDDWVQAINGVSLSEKYAAWRDYAAAPDGSGIYAAVCRDNRPARFTQAELEAHPAWRGFGAHAAQHPPMRGWLAVPLIGHGGRNLGLVQLSDKLHGEFDEQDQAVLVQLASIASVSIENTRLYEALRAQDRRKDEFLATLAHELRNPLAPIRTGLGVLRLAPTPEAAARVQAMMERQVAHMVRLIDDLLDVSRITSGRIDLRRERVDLATVVEAALEVSRPIIDAGGHRLTVRQAPEPIVLEADVTRLAQVVSNLLNNAAKYTPDGGALELETRRERDQAVIVVRDDGVGLAPEHLPYVFDLFSQVGRTLDRAQGGLGIGLALVRRLVEMHGGEVTATSDGAGRGSTFVVRLPIASPDAHGVPVHEAPGRAVHRARRVLIVDDNVDAAQSLSMLLELDGHVTEVAHDGATALVRAAAFGPDTVVLDIDLPDIDGVEVARRLRERPDGAALRLVALTGFGSDGDRERTRDGGFDVHLTKPVDADRLRAVLDGAE